MQHLRRLQVKGQSWGEIEGHPRLEQINKLQTLSDVKAGKWMEGCLGNLTNLRKLGIRLSTEADAEVWYESIANLVCLQSLTVVALGKELETIGLSVPPLSHLLRLSKLRLQVKLEKLPESTEFPTNLSKLILSDSCLEQDPLATLEKLKNLRILRLYGSFEGVEMACSAQGFPRLESLHLQFLPQLEEWRVEEGAMPSLLHLKIKNCRRLNQLPGGLQHLTSLKKLELWEMADEFKERLREDGGDDWHKIRHIPSIHTWQ
ncbi:probable disease resistance protein At1g58602 [Magnolia sinica]|uniref:probable disease resistance protein At1g58602 n=1 Tax=Magnolia sinica TaxID=86752 RepID=UPI002659C2BD|nr:probable disease resistance protein At1g58602 [Magnolia sinica]